MSKYAIATSGLGRNGTVWVTRSLIANTPASAHITHEQINRDNVQLFGHWLTGKKDHYIDVNSGWSMMLPFLRQFKPKVCLLVRNPYRHLRSLLSWQYFKHKKPQPSKQYRQRLVRSWLPRIYGTLELGVQVVEALGLEWKPFGLNRFTTADGLRELMEFAGLPVNKKIVLNDKDRNKSPGYIPLDTWFPETRAYLKEFDGVFTKAAELHRVTGEAK